MSALIFYSYFFSLLALFVDVHRTDSKPTRCPLPTNEIDRREQQEYQEGEKEKIREQQIQQQYKQRLEQQRLLLKQQEQQQEQKHLLLRHQQLQQQQQSEAERMQEEMYRADQQQHRIESRITSTQRSSQVPGRKQAPDKPKRTFEMDRGYQTDSSMFAKGESSMQVSQSQTDLNKSLGYEIDER